MLLIIIIHLKRLRLMAYIIFYTTYPISQAFFVVLQTHVILSLFDFREKNYSLLFMTRPFNYISWLSKIVV